MANTVAPTLFLTTAPLLARLTPEEWADAMHRAHHGLPPVSFPVRVTLSKHWRITDFTRLPDADGERPAITPETVGKRPVNHAGGLAVDALMTLGVRGQCCPGRERLKEHAVYVQIAPLTLPADGMDDYFHAKFRLRAPFLPLPPTLQHAPDIQSATVATAIVDIATQTVLGLQCHADDRLFNIGDPRFGAGDGQIAVMCRLERGGCFFGCLIV